MTHPAELPAQQLLRDCQLERTRRGGPGGQHRNKVETAIVIHHKPTGVSAEASERRSQEDNRRVAISRLRLQLALAIRTTRAASQGPSPLWQSRTRSGKVQVSEKHDDFPAMLAEALDCVVECEYDVASAARQLKCTTSQLVKLLQKEPAALKLVNRHRTELGLHTFK